MRRISFMAFAVLLVLSGCTVGPRYSRPSPLPDNATAPAAYKEAPTAADGWKVAIGCFDGVSDLEQWLIRAFKELRIHYSGKDYGEPTLQFDQG